jgi:MinD-like ATPase involved in chromosome partitioning or flagellar assembly
MYTITFYSFKGGVGRTMALVNVAARLAKMGRRVLLIDFDLEAPGLETFDRLRPAPLPPRPVEKWKDGILEGETRAVHTTPSHQGVVEYVTEYVRTNCSPDVRDYIYSAGAVGKKGGQLWVMPAGRRDDAYQSALARIDWQKLYREQDGFLLFEDTKAQWEHEFKPDYVLIDSRTGHTDVEGICTRQLADAVVVLFFPNEQNLVGLQAVCQRIRDEATSGLMKHIRLHFVMSNVPDLDDEDRILRRWRKEFDFELDIGETDAIIHRYDSAMLFDQAIFVLDRPKSRLAHEYKRLVRRLITHNPADRDGALVFLKGYASHLIGSARLFSPTRIGASLILAGRIDYGLPGSSGDPLDQIARNFPGDAEIQRQVVRCREAEKELREKCERVLSESPEEPS